MNKTTKLALILVLILVIIFSAYSIYINTAGVLAQHYLDVDVAVEEGGAYKFNIDSDALHFGVVQANMKQTRYFDVGNEYEHPIQVEVSTRGQLRNLIQLSETSFSLDIGEERRVDVTLVAPSDPGNYTGEVIVRIKNEN